jgi:hypothetical protein
MGPGLSSVLCWVAGLDALKKGVRVTAELRKQPRVPQEPHLRKLLTAAHTYSQNWSRITSISSSVTGRTWGRVARGLAKPSRACFEGDCRSRLGWRFTSPLGRRP